MQFDHVAVESRNIDQSVMWYKEKFSATVLYQDSTWALLQLAGLKLALVTPQQHPPHLAMAVTKSELSEAAQAAGLSIVTHRDRTEGIYLHDPSGNVVELICYPDRKE
jgi:catechol-2,3-dioxygenase